jgi:hypothetical protein
MPELNGCAFVVFAYPQCGMLIADLIPGPLVADDQLSALLEYVSGKKINVLNTKGKSAELRANWFRDTAAMQGQDVVRAKLLSDMAITLKIHMAVTLKIHMAVTLNIQRGIGGGL